MFVVNGVDYILIFSRVFNYDYIVENIMGVDEFVIGYVVVRVN